LLIAAMITTAALPAPAGNAPSPDHDVTIELPGAGAMTFRLLPAGRFIMGSQEGEKHGAKDEKPAHEVVISKPFYLAVHEVTCAQWKRVMGSLPDDAGNDPAAAVSGVLFDDCHAFIRELAAQGFGSFRLPTEAEWEYACRAGTTTRFYWGDDPDHTQADAHCWHKGNAGGRTHPPGLKTPNPWGLHDMAGNAWEWCSDWYGPYPAAKQIDPTGPKTGKARVLRGNGRRWGPHYCRSANRFNRAEGHTTGLRLVLVKKPG
jgi:formylglycine-generating enzyme required for sulfatase activity